MKPTFQSRELSFLLQITVFTLILFGVHSYLLAYLAPDTAFFFPIWQIYVFHWVITALFYTLINYKFSIGKTEIFNTFMLGTIAKMVVSILFLLPLLLSDFDNKQPDVFNFFIPYFLYLFFEVYSVTQFLQKSP
ncbi:MAG: hypothetical protein R2783_05525 [Gelidibacter sp.]